MAQRTFQSLALTFLALVLYLLLVRALVFVPTVLSWITDAAPVSRAQVELWQTWADPFTALALVLDPPLDSTGLSPAQGFALVMLGWTVLLNATALWKLRVWNPSGEPLMQREQADVNDEAIDRTRAMRPPARFARSGPTRSSGARSPLAPTADARFS